MPVFVDAWRGFSVTPPEGWRAVFPPVEGVAFVPSDGNGFLELSMVEGADARAAARQRLSTLSPPQVEPLSEQTEQAGYAFDDGRSRGEVQAKLAGGRVLVVLAQLPTDGPLHPHQLITDLVRSLTAVEPVPRQRWTEPTEQAFSLLLPEGWQPQSAIRPNGAGRDVLARVSRDERTWAAIEPGMATFVNGPPQLPFDRPLPLQPGLQPLIQQVIHPQLAQAYGGGVELIGHECWNDPLKAEARFALPDGTVRVVMLLAAAMPGAPHWVGGSYASYAASADELSEIEAVLRAVLASSKTDQRWQAAETAMRQQVHNSRMADQQAWGNLQTSLHHQRMNDIAAAGQANTAIHHQRMATSDQQFASWHRTSASQDQQQHDAVNAIRGTSDYLDQSTGQLYTIADGYERVWTDQQGTFVAADWNLDPPSDWTELRRMNPGERPDLV